ncbi:MAG: M16 family metallopeptidase [Bryobacteraceae bacterium]
MSFSLRSRTLSLLLLACFLLLIPAARLRSQGAGAVPGVPRLEFEKYTLPNGLQVILHVDRKLPMVHVNSWYHVGSKNERAGRTGFAHLFEHMMFEGSKNANVKYLSLIEKAGANLSEGGVNGTTSEYRTNYFETVPAGSLEYVLWLESDRLATLTDVLTQAKLDNERNIVKNERRQIVENRPYGRAFTLLSENLFPYGHPYAHSAIGSQEDLTAASVDDVKQFFQTYYTPNNLTLAITGDFEIAEAKRLVAKYYGPIPSGPALDRPKLLVPALSSEKVIEVNDHVPLQRVYIAWPSPAFFQPDDAELDLASAILSDGLSSRLNKALVYDKQLCSNVVSFQQPFEISGMFLAVATARPGASLAAIERGVTEEIAKLATDGPAEQELARAKAKWELQYLSGLERIGGFGGQADVLNQYNTYLGDPDKFAADVNRHRLVTINSVKSATGKWLNTSNRLLIRFHPEKMAPEPATVTLDRSRPPALGQDVAFQVPEVKTAKLENGLDVFVVERKDLPKVNLTVASRAGSVSDPQDLPGLASLDATTMLRGTKTRTALDIDDALGDLGTGISGFANREYALVSLDVLKANLAPALAVVADVVRNPNFPAEEVEREKKKAADRLAQADNDPTSIARRVGPMLAFGRTHPYGHPVNGFRSSIAKITPAELIRFHETYWKPGSSAIIFAGDISLADAVNMSKQFLGAWSGGAAPAASIEAPQPMGPGKVFMIHRPEAAQTDVSLVVPGAPRNNPDYFPLTLADAVWGGAAGARLSLNLREDKGYSYVVRSSPQFYSKYGSWIARGGVQTDKTKESVVEFEKELRFMAGEKPVSEKELASAKQTLVKGYAQQFESLERVSGQIAQLWSLSLPTSELQREPAELIKVTLSSVNGVAEKYATPSKASLLLVGDTSKIESGIKSLNIGEIVTLDTEGKPLERP